MRERGEREGEERGKERTLGEERKRAAVWLREAEASRVC